MRVPKTLEIIRNKSKSQKKNQFKLIVKRSVDLCLNLYHRRVRKFNKT